jgi:hypothetical protein
MCVSLEKFYTMPWGKNLAASPALRTAQLDSGMVTDVRTGTGAGAVLGTWMQVVARSCHSSSPAPLKHLTLWHCSWASSAGCGVGQIKCPRIALLERAAGATGGAFHSLQCGVVRCPMMCMFGNTKFAAKDPGPTHFTLHTQQHRGWGH